MLSFVHSPSRSVPGLCARCGGIGAGRRRVVRERLAHRCHAPHAVGSQIDFAQSCQPCQLTDRCVRTSIIPSSSCTPAAPDPASTCRASVISLITALRSVKFLGAFGYTLPPAHLSDLSDPSDADYLDKAYGNVFKISLRSKSSPASLPSPPHCLTALIALTAPARFAQHVVQASSWLQARCRSVRQ